jgi:transposase
LVTFPTNGGRGGQPAQWLAKESAIMARRRVYSIEFQDEACKLVTKQGYTHQQAADKLGVTRVTMGAWLKKRGLLMAPKLVEPDYAASEDPALLKARIKELEKRLARSEIEREILKKATAYFASQSL